MNYCLIDLSSIENNVIKEGIIICAVKHDTHFLNKGFKMNETAKENYKNYLKILEDIIHFKKNIPTHLFISERTFSQLVRENPTLRLENYLIDNNLTDTMLNSTLYEDYYLTNLDKWSEECYYYIMSFENEEEKFFKYGLSKDISKRKRTFERKLKGYNINIIFNIKINKIKAHCLEYASRRFIMTNPDYQYKSIIKFDGESEVFNSACDIEKLKELII